MILTRFAPFLSVEEAWSLAIGVIFSIEPIGRLKERAPALHAVLCKYGCTNAAAVAARQRIAPPVGPHRPIAATDADAEVPGDEVGQDAFNLNAAATIAPLLIEGGHRAQEMVVTPLEIGPGQVSDVSVQTPTLGEHGFGA